MTTNLTFDPTTMQQLTTQGLLQGAQPQVPPDISDVQVVIWSRAWNIVAGPIRCQLECYINYTPQVQSFVFGAEATMIVLGKTVTFKREFPVNGDTEKHFVLPFNSKLQLDIHDWTYSPNQLACDLLIRLRAGMVPFITIYQGRIAVAIPQLQEIQELCMMRLDGPTLQALQTMTTIPVTVNETRQPAQYGTTYSQF